MRYFMLTVITIIGDLNPFSFIMFHRSLPSTSDEDFDSIFSELDDSGDFKVFYFENS